MCDWRACTLGDFMVPICTLGQVMLPHGVPRFRMPHWKQTTFSQWAANLWFQRRPIYGLSHTTSVRKAFAMADAFIRFLS
jgi:hypothetical protein